MKRTSKVGKKMNKEERDSVWGRFFPASFPSFLISSEITERDEFSRAMNPSVRVAPALRWNSMNSPYCCLMETGTQTNAQPLPGSAPRVLINPAAETLMALIFQTKAVSASQHSHNRREFQ